MSIEAMKQALNKAFQLGQRYWSLADSEYSSHWKKADVAKAEFDKLVEDTLRTAIEQAEKQEPVGYKPPAKWTDAEIKDGYRGIRWVTADGVYGRPTEEDVARYLGYTTPPATPVQEFVCSTGLCHYKTQPAPVLSAGPITPEMANWSEADKAELTAVMASHLTTPPAQPAPECTRSHPHENMDAMCELRTEIARLTNENARLKAQPASVQEKNNEL